MTCSLWETCASMREVITPRGSRFLLCRLSKSDPAFPKYPRQPVVRCGRRVSVYMSDPGERLGLLTTATVGEGDWVDLAEPILVRAGEAFVAVPGQAAQPS